MPCQRCACARSALASSALGRHGGLPLQPWGQARGPALTAPGAGTGACPYSPGGRHGRLPLQPWGEGTGACPYLVAGAALDIEDRASVAAATYEPFTLARVAKAERAAAYRSGGHAAATDGTDYGLLTDKGILDLGELDRGVLGGLGHAFILRKCSVCRRPVR